MAENEQRRRGVPLVVSAPSGGGKTTLCRKLIGSLSDVHFSISYTTRPLRGAEENGVDYFFVSSTEFDQLVANGAFLEWAHVHGHRYGTHRKLTEDLLSAGQDVLFDIDIQGGRQIADALEDTALLFVLPPNRDVLEARLRGRLSDSEEQIVRRLEAAHDEIKEAGFYDYWIINEDLDKALEEMKSVLWAERLKRSNKELMKQVFFMQGND